MPIKTYPFTLVEEKLIAPKVKHLAFAPPSELDFTFNPGQFITFHFEIDGKILRRSYSIATIPGQSDLIEIAVNYVESGPGSTILFNLKPGETLNTAGPFGRLVLRDESPKRYLMFATSTGVTPYRAMIPEFSKRFAASPDLKVVVLQGVQYKQDLLYADDFLELANKHPNFEFRAHYSREKFESAGQAYEYPGYVQSALKEFNPNADEDIVYLCGNPAMIDETFACLKDQYNFSMQNIRREKYISS